MHTFEITELHRRVANLIILGQIIATDYEQALPVVKVKVGEITTAWLPMLTQRAGNDISWWPLETGEQVVVLSPSGELAQGVVIGAINQSTYPAAADRADVHRHVYADGAVIEYDRHAHRLSATLPVGATTQLVSTGGVEIIGDISVTGHINASGDITDHTRSMQADRAIYNDHTHAGIATGRASTKKPNESQ